MAKKKTRRLGPNTALHAVIPESPGARTPGSQQASKRTKATFYVDTADMTALEDERRRRIDAGTPRAQVDLSSLVREAIKTAYAG